MERTCRVCKTTYNITRFPSAGIKNGTQYYRQKCQKCYQKGKRHRRTILREWMNDFKIQLSCEKCGYSKNTHQSFKTQALQFHHKNDNKEFEISNMVHRGFAKKTIINEMKKCVVLCARCHIEEHY